MILTVTLNAALDVTYRVDRLRPHQTHRVTGVTTRAGGKGVNVAGVLVQLREPAVATGLAGGETGERIHAGLADARIPDAMVPTAANSRRTVTVVEAAEGDATGFWEPGPLVTAAEWAAFQDRYRGLLKIARAVVLSGSLPPGLPTDAYAQLIATARELEVPAVLDTDGPALTAAVAAGPTLVKPNRDELRRAFPDLDLADLSGVVAGARSLRDQGAGAVVVSLGADGMVAVTGDGAVLRAAPPAPVAGNPTGAGDAAVAALARGLAHRTPWPRLLAQAVAASAAAVAEPVAGRLDVRLYDRLRREISTDTLSTDHPDHPDQSGGE